MNEHLREVPYARVYLDEIVIFSSVLSSPMQDAKMVLERKLCLWAKIGSEEGYICKNNAHLLGHVVSKQGIAVNHEKIHYSKCINP